MVRLEDLATHVGLEIAIRDKVKQIVIAPHLLGERFVDLQNLVSLNGQFLFGNVRLFHRQAHLF